MLSQEKHTVVKDNISKNIKFLLLNNNKSRKEVCKDLNIKYTTFCDWINGKTIPGYSRLEELGNYFRVEPWEFYGNIEEGLKKRASILDYYASNIEGGKILDMEILSSLNDEQIKKLLESGFTFRHRKLEEYIELAGGTLRASEEYDWGEPVGRELW